MRAGERCGRSAGCGDWICTRPAGHTGIHENRQRGSVFAAWDEYDADDEDYACAHTSMTGADNLPLHANGKLWRCDVCGTVMREIEDPNGTTWISGFRNENARKVRYEVVSC